MSVQVSVDFSDPRIRLRRMVHLVDGTSWDMSQSGTAVGLDPITKTIMLLPSPYHPGWQTGGAGDYARLRKADYNLTTPSAWVEHVRPKHSADYYLHAINTNEKVYTGKIWDKNQPMFLSWVNYNAGNELFVQMECGWGEGAEDGDVRLRFYSDGSLEVYRNGSLVNTGNLHDNNAYPNSLDKLLPSGGNVGTQMPDRTVDVLLIPCRRRELLILSPTEGGGCNFLFDTMDPDASPDTTSITAAGRFWWQVPEGQATVQCAPIRFPVTGDVVGPLTRLRYPPASGGTADVTVYSDTPGRGTVSVVGSAVIGTAISSPFVGNGTVDLVRGRAYLTGDGANSPWVYGMSVAFAGSVENTAGTATRIDDYILADPQISLHVPESPSDVRFEFTCKKPAALGTVAPDFRWMSNRPIQLALGTVPVFKGRTEKMDFTQGLGDDMGDRLFVSCRDRWKAFEKYIIDNPEPLDGMNLGTAIAYLVKLCGYGTADMNIDTIDFDLPKVTAASKGEWALIPNRGDMVSDWLNRLHRDFAATYYMGWKPVATDSYKFCFQGTATLGTIPVGTVYASQSSTADPRLWARSFRSIRLEPEANDITVRGKDPRTKGLIIAHYSDINSQDPTIAVNARPDNWLGERREYILNEPGVTTQNAANYALGILRDRLTQAQDLYEWESELLFKSSGVPVWRGDPVLIEGIGTVRIETFTMNSVHEGSFGTWRPTTYTARLI